MAKNNFTFKRYYCITFCPTVIPVAKRKFRSNVEDRLSIRCIGTHCVRRAISLLLGIAIFVGCSTARKSLIFPYEFCINERTYFALKYHLYIL